jgi:hypothetical protein
VTAAAETEAEPAARASSPPDKLTASSGNGVERAFRAICILAIALPLLLLVLVLFGSALVDSLAAACRGAS